MHYELWGINTGNRIATQATEIEALALVRELLAVGWHSEELGLVLAPDDDSERVAVKKVLEGKALAKRAYAAG